MSSKKCNSCGYSKASPDPTSSKYSKEINNKAHSKSPYGTDEPSTHTTYK